MTQFSDLPAPRLLSARAPEIAATDMTCLFVVQNERLRLPDCLRHHRALGISRFLAIDDRSTDGTREYLLEQPDVSVFEVDAKYAESQGGARWKNAILDLHATDRWVLVIDVDELLVYPHDDGVDLARFCAWLDSRGATATVATMVDMYPRDLAAVSGFSAGDRMLEACPWFDRDSYIRGRRRAFPRDYLRGGPRARLFYDQAPPAWARVYMAAYRRLEPLGLQRLLLNADVSPWEPPFLTKVSLVRWRKGMRFRASTHWLSPEQRVAEVTTALLHFKFLGDFADKVAHAVAAKNYWKGSIEYRHYAEKLARDPSFGFAYAGSARYGGPADLIAAGLLHDSADFAAFAADPGSPRATLSRFGGAGAA
jgi:hypothetical protein